MSIQSAPYYWITCDWPECAQRCPDPDDEYSAWVDVSGALAYADDSEWQTRESHHYCPDHALRICERCGALNYAEYPGEWDYLCPACWLEDVRDRAAARDRHPAGKGER
jgi:hypothetical protein